MIADFICRDCRAKCWCDDRDPASRIRLQYRVCRSCDRCAEDDVRARFGAVVRRETARVVEGRHGPQVKPFARAATYPTFLGEFGCALICVAILSVPIAAPFVATAFTVGGGAAFLLWFAQLAGHFLA